MATIQGIYIALFGRPADPLGLQYFNEATNDGADLTAIGDLASTAEYQTRFEGMDNAGIVTEIFQSLFGRNPELAGLTFFVNALNSGELNINNVAIAILDGAQGDDLATVNNKIAAATAFTAALDTPDEIAAYRGDIAADLGRQFLSPITADEATVPTAEQVATAVEGVVTGEGTPGQVFTLTSTTNVATGGVDTVVGTAGDDTFRAITADALDSVDTLTGGAGFDTLVISANGLINTSPAPVISGIERINNSSNNTLDLSKVTGLQQAWAQNTANTYTGAALATVFGLEGATAAYNVNIEYADLAGASTANFAANNANAAGDVTFVVTDGDKVEAATVALGTANTADVDISSLTEVASITVTGAGDATIINTSTDLTKFDASAATGDITYTSGAVTGEVAVTGGSGNDTFNFAAATAASEVTIDGGAGNDIIDGGLGNDTLNGGTGNDVIFVSGSATDTDTATGGAGADSFVFDVLGTAGAAGVAFKDLANQDHITDFTSADDQIILDATAFAGAGLTVAAGNLDLPGALAAGRYVEVTLTDTDALVSDFETAAAGAAAPAAAAYVAAVAIGTETWLVYDANGTGTAGGVSVIGILDGKGLGDISAADFGVIA
ncbi:hypothetical protein LJR030_002862 [Rhizobium sp. LjRoot30]|uniref:DUF4214 domain-containing protein n=1 Tax=Rhizobium sp. LjRoot30 TaxID=3342320 RepID=UPI003ECD05A6